LSKKSTFFNKRYNLCDRSVISFIISLAIISHNWTVEDATFVYVMFLLLEINISLW